MRRKKRAPCAFALHWQTFEDSPIENGRRPCLKFPEAVGPYGLYDGGLKHRFTKLVGRDETPVAFRLSSVNG
jgi:hypothetical protein